MGDSGGIGGGPDVRQLGQPRLYPERLNQLLCRSRPPQPVEHRQPAWAVVSDVNRADLLAEADQAARLWPFFSDVEKAHGLPSFLLTALGSRETNLNAEYANGKVHDDGHGWGLFGADDRWNNLPPGFASNPRAQAELAATTLALNYVHAGNWLDAVNAYGPAGARPGYGQDVLERRQYLADHEGGPMPDLPPIDDSPPDEEHPEGPPPPAEEDARADS